MSSKTVILSNQIVKVQKYYEIPPIRENVYFLNHINGQVQKLTITNDSKIYLDPHNLFDLQKQRNTFIKFILLVNNTNTDPVKLDFLLKSFRIFTNNISDDGLTIDPQCTYLIHIYSFDNGYTWRLLLGSKFGPGVNWGESDPSLIQNGIKKPIIIGALAPVKSDLLPFPETSPFENLDTAVILDNHMSTDYRITKDIEGNDVLFLVNKTDYLLGDVNLSLPQKLEGETEYYISCRYRGTLYVSEWSDPIGIIIISCQPDAPEIISYTQYDFHVMNDGNDSILFETSEYITATENDQHRITDLKICTDEEGNNPVYEINDISDPALFKNYKLTDLSKLTVDTKYYLFARYGGTICTTSEWSDPTMIEYISGIYSESGRRLYRHESGKGTVMEYREYDGSFRKVVILDAKYRTTNIFLKNQIYVKPGLTAYIPNNTYITGSSIVPNTNPLVKFTDSQINTKLNGQQDIEKSKHNCDAWLRVSADIGNALNYGIYFTRNQTVFGGRCDIPTFNILTRMYVEAKNIDALDPTIADYPNNKLANNSQNFSFFGKEQISSSVSKFDWTNVATLQYNYYIYRRSYTGNSFFITPIFELYDIDIKSPKVLNYESLGDFNSSYLTSAHSEDHVKTNWKVFSDPECNNLLYETSSSVDDPEYIDIGESFDFKDNLKYYIRCQHIGSYSGESDWSVPYEFKYLKNKKKVYRLPSKRKIYRHSSDKGSVLEYVNYDGKLVKLLILDAAYRKDCTNFASANFNNTKTTAVGYVNKYNKSYIEVSEANYTNLNYNTRSLPILSDKDFNAMYICGRNTVADGSSKDICNTWMEYSYVNNGSLNLPIPYCRSKVIDGIECDLPTIHQLRLIFLESESIDALDPTVISSPSFTLGRRNPNLFWGLNNQYTISCTKSFYTSTINNTIRYYINTIDKYGQCSSMLVYYDSSYTYRTIPILELPSEIIIDKPTIISPQSDEIIYTNSEYIIIKANSYSSDVVCKHQSTNWKICTDSLGENIVCQSFDDSINLTEIVLFYKFSPNTTYYVFVQYTNKLGISSEWSDPVKFINGHKKVLKSNRKLYRHHNNLGSVLEFNDNNLDYKVLILDAKYRQNSKDLQFGLFGTIVPLTNYTTCPTPNCTFSGAEYDPFTEIPSATDDVINAQWGQYLDSNSSFENCNIWMNEENSTDVKHIVGSPVVKYCRNTLLKDIKLSCDLPNINTLLRIYFDADEIDSLDPTVAEFKNNKLGMSNDQSTFWGNTIALSSTNFDKYSVRTVSYTGYISKHNKQDTFVLINDRLSSLFIIPVFDLTNVDKIKTPIIENPVNGEYIYV